MTEEELAAIEQRIEGYRLDGWTTLDCRVVRALTAECRRLARYEALVASFCLGERGIDGDAFGDAALDLYFAGQDLVEADAGTIAGGGAPAPARAAGAGEGTR